MKKTILLAGRQLFNKNIQYSCNYTLNCRFLSKSEAVERRNHLFSLEQKRQRDNVGRIEKIEVHYKGLPEEKTLLMNRDISTPYDCARHLSQWHAEHSALALVNGEQYWHMHRPLQENCTLELQHYTVADPYQVNRAFWRSCSFVLGACLSVAFKDSYTVKLHSFPTPDIRSGSFVYDVSLPELEEWNPTEQELITLSAEFVKICRAGAQFEMLEVDEVLALELFKDNEFKSQQIPNIATKNRGKIMLFRLGTHVDISKGPMVGSASQIGRATVASVHRIVNSDASDQNALRQLYRFQGVALPVGIIVNHVAYGVLEKRARKLNSTHLPFDDYRDDFVPLVETSRS